MPRKCKIVGKMKNLYMEQTLDNCLFAHVYAIKTHLPGVSLQDAILQFMKIYEITEEDISLDTLKTKYERIKKRFLKGNSL